MSNIRQFRVLTGVHYITDKKVAKKGEIVRSTEDLTAVFPGKFEEVNKGSHEVVPQAVDLVLPAEQRSAPPVAKQEKEDSPVQVTGKDVSKRWPEAEDSDLRVVKNDDGYFVTTEEMPDYAINSKPLTKTEVGDFIAKHAKANA